MIKVKSRWTVVQHSGYGYGNKQEFRFGLETAKLDTLGEQQAVLKAGGKLFDSYEEAAKYEDEEPYRGRDYCSCGGGLVLDLWPVVPGTFSDVKVNGLRVYVPKEPATCLDREVESSTGGTP